MKKRFLSLILAAALLFGNAFAFAEGDIENTDNNIPAVTETAQTQTPVTDQAEEPEPASPSSGEPASEPESEAADFPEQPVR